MRAVGFQGQGGIDRDAILVDIDLPVPAPAGRDLLVEVRAVSVNPIDAKARRSSRPADGSWRVLGWDASGVVSAVGPAVAQFHVGDPVFYAGAIERSGTNAQYHLVDGRIVGAKPRSLDWAEAAALPLTAITAWEALFDRLDVAKPVRGAAHALLIIGGAGGVSSIAIQLARALTDLTVIATASRPETVDWVREMGAHQVVDHDRPLAAQVAELGLGSPAFVFSTTHTGQHLAEIAELIAPQGRLAVIDGPLTPDVDLLEAKSVSIHWETVFTRTSFCTADMAEQGKLLGHVSRLIDEDRLRTTATERLAPIDAANLMRAHAMMERGGRHGKIVLEGFAGA